MAPQHRERRATLQPTFVQARAAHYLRPGGPWQRGPLDASFVVHRRSTRDPGPAVYDGVTRLDAAGMEAQVAELAGRLHASGVGRGAVVAWQLPNGAAALLLYRACWRLGAVAAPVHHRLGLAEVVGRIGPGRPGGHRVRRQPAGRRAPRCRRWPPTTPRPLRPSPSFLRRAAPSKPGRSKSKAADVAVALFTSGSTGVPKAALHTHRSLGYKAELMVGVHGLDHSDAVLLPAPLAHVSGLLNGVLLPAAAAIPTVIMSAWDPDEALRRIAEERVSFMGAPPVFFSQMAASSSFTAEAVSSLRLVSTGGASVSPAFVEATAAAFGCRVKRTYGSTEAPTVTTSGPGDSLEAARDTDGRPVGEVELEVHDPDSGELVAPGEVGEIWLRGPELFVGYADEALTERTLADPGRWFRTGDLGTTDEDGWLRVVGRMSDIIIRAGENISASEVEAVLESHPTIRCAVAVAVPDRDLGERVAAFIESSEPFDLDLCRQWFSERGITRFKTPEFVVRLDVVPSLATGKPDRAALRTMAAELAR